MYIKTAERAHAPKKMWQKIRLKKQYSEALKQVDEHLAYWPKFLVHKNKQRLTKITQYLIRMRKLQLKVKPKLVTMPARKEKMEKRREKKAEAAAQLDRAIEKELLERLKSGTYGDIYNFPSLQYERVLSKEAVTEDGQEIEHDVMDEVDEEYEEYIEDEEESEEEEIEYLDDVDFEESEDDMEDYGSSEDEAEEGSDEDEDMPSTSTGVRKKSSAGENKPASKRRRHVELEYEEENLGRMVHNN